MTLDILIEEVRRLASESPNSIYHKPSPAGCSYIDGECGKGKGCILGQAAKNVWPKLFKKMEASPFLAFSSWLFDGFTGERNSFIFQRQIGWLRGVQNYQDSLRPWKEAVEMADKDRRLIGVEGDN